MKFFLKTAIFVNKAPFDKLELNFSENEVGVLSAVNGRGKTTILSHIVDSFYEIAKLSFINEFERKANKFYRVSSPIHNLKLTDPSFVYLRFEINDQSRIEEADYLEIRNKCTEDQYNKAINLPNKIHFSQFKNALSENFVKVTSLQNLSNKEKIKKVGKLFQNNLLTYFPSYRYEQPGYLNDPYKIKLDFEKTAKFSGYLKNPIEVISGLPQLTNWIMDVVLDWSVNTMTHEKIMLASGPESVIWNNLNNVISKILTSKKYGVVRFGVGPRHSGAQRINICRDTLEQGNRTVEQVYPNIFNLSSGEASLLSLFGELLRQADNNKTNIQLSEITGIVLIDEIDKHLHIKLQKEILPQLFAIFPNVQFITSSHSPFVGMGLADDVIIKERSKIIDLDNFGISQDPTSNELYTEVYNMMINENERFKNLYQSLEQKIKDGTKPLIITEGKTDVKHIKRAIEKLNNIDCNFDFYEVDEERGDEELKKMLEYTSKVLQNKKIIGIFDRDVSSIISDVEKDNQKYKSYGNNVYAFCLSIPESRKDYKNISIEFYYSDENLKKEKNGKSLYFDNEVAKMMSSKQLIKLEKPEKDRELDKKIFDKNIGNLNWIHSKSAFAHLVETDEDFISDFDFGNFKLIFDKIKKIISLN